MARDKESLLENLTEFMREDLERPVFMEVFTEMKQDADAIYDFFDLSRPRNFQSEIIRKSKDLIKSTIGQEKIQSIVDNLKN